MLFDNFSSRSLKLSNRIELVPMTRSQATPTHAPGAKGYTDFPTLTVATGALA